jgi:hypothetical protein
MWPSWGKQARTWRALSYGPAMSVHIKYNGGGDFDYEDKEGLAYRYAIGDNGTLSVYERQGDVLISKDAEPLAVYGPAAWFSVSGTQLKKEDTAVPRLRGF